MKRSLSCQPDRQRAVALIVTLIMLAVITVLAVAFLALTRRETAAVDAMGRTTEAELAADSGLERAKAEILAAFIRRNATNNGIERMGPDFMVSVAVTNAQTNRLNSVGMFINPSPPVFVNTNRPGTPPPTSVAGLDDRSYLDLNRNGLFDETGYVLETDDSGNIIPNSFHWEVGDPQWIGILQQPQFPHSRTNYFVGRYAYAVLPVGRGLDVNWMHNQTVQRAGNGDGYSRNQGFGTYEINLAAFLADLNTNAWHRPSPAVPDAYAFDPNPLPSSQGSRGLAFIDARELLNFRYGGSPNNLLSINQMFPSIDTHFGISSTFPDWIDGYANGPIEPMGGPIYRQVNPNPNPEANDDPVQPWPGSDNPRKFFALHDFFDPGKVDPNGFARRLREVGEGTNPYRPNSYNRYTYYRMLAQLGTDSDDEGGGKININYKNRDGVSARQFVNWTPIEMFTNISQRLLRDELGMDVHRVPIYTNNSAIWTNQQRIPQGPLYSSRIHQILQIAANICDATYSNKFNETFPFYPSVFRPRFERRSAVPNEGPEGIYIVDYEEVTDIAPVNAAFLSLDEAADRARINPSDNIHIYGIPFIIGARKGFPNFNELVVQSAVAVSRKLEFVKRNATDTQIRQTNQQFIIGISNTFGVEAWFPYTNTGAYPPAGRDAGIRYANSISITLTNNAGLSLRRDVTINGTQPILSQSWTGGVAGVGAGIKVPPIVVTNSLWNSVYRQYPSPSFELVSGNNTFDEGPLYTNRWGLMVTNRFFYFLTERGPDGREHIVDAVSLAGADKYLDISSQLFRGPANSAIAGSWRLEPVRGVPGGVYNQIQVSLGNVDANADWNSFGGLNPATGQDKQKAIDAFRVFMGLTPLIFPPNALPPATPRMQAPFTPARRLFQTTSWAVNDPLVHYRVEDLSTEPAYARFTNQSEVVPFDGISGTVSLMGSFSSLSNRNTRYNPWSGRDGSGDSAAYYETSTTDPGVFSPDYWDFPQQKFPNVGWLGRVHRGTPWQTIYFKAKPVSPGLWRNLTGGAYDSRTFPTNDWRLADLFTVAVHPNQTRGRLSINQTNLAAWSAVLSGIQVSTIEDLGGRLVRTNQTAQPAAVDYPLYGTNTALFQLLGGPAGISVVRTNASRRSTGFTRLEEILAVPALTDESPFLGQPYSATRLREMQGSRWTYPATDSDYERIPQQILSLLRAGESRFVVYAWGQSLKAAGPVPGFGTSTVTSGSDRGLVKNYQVTGEMATRAVIRVEFEDELARDDDGNVIVDPATRQPVKTGRRDYGKPHAFVESFNIIPVD